MDRSSGPMDKNRIQGAADQGERARFREALVTKGKRIQLKQWKRGRTIFRELTAIGAKPEVAQRVAGNSRCWWRNSGMLINTVLTIKWADQLGMPKLA